MTTTINNEHKKLNVPNKQEQNQTCLDFAEREELRPKGNVPNLRFPEFQGEWQEHKLEDITAEIGDGIHATPIYDDNGTYYFVNGNNISEYGIIITATTQKVTEEEALRNNASALNSYSILLSINGTVGNVALYKNESIMLGKSACYINVSSNINRNYIFYYLMMPKCQFYFTSELTGTTIKNLSLKSIRKTKVLLPNANEQSKIARLFDAINERIETQNKIIEDLKKLKSAIIENHYNQTEKQTASIADLGEPFSVGNLAKDDLTETGIPCVVYGELFTTYGETISQIESHTNKTTGMILSKKGDLLFPSSTTVDAMSLIAPSVINVEGVILGGDMFGIHINHNYNAQYLSYYFNHIAKRQLAKFAKGSTIIHLHYADIEKAKLLLPSLEEQNRMAKCIMSLGAKINIENFFISLLNSQKTHLLRQMFI